MMDTERRWRMTMPGLELVALNVVSWRRMPGSGEQWRSKLRLNWAPEQIAGWLKKAHPEDESYRVSHETIYRSLFVQARGVLKKELLSHLRSKRTIRRSKQAGLNGDGRGQIKDIVSIRERRWGNRPAGLWIAEDFGCCASG
jgi:hypothetical protein